MFDRSTAQNTDFSAILKEVFLLAILLLSFGSSANAQYSRTIYDGYTPTGVEQGAPAGAYPLSGFENVNLFNGSLGIALPLLKVGGRGTAGYTMMVQMDKHWQIYRAFENPVTEDEVQFRAGRSWRVGYSPGFLIGLLSTDLHFNGQCPLPPAEVYRQYLSRLSFIMPDGTEIFLHDKEFGGTPASTRRCVPEPGYRNRGKVFVSADGESLTFISDNTISDGPVDGPLSTEFLPSGYLLMSNGTRYRIDEGRVSWIRDRNGNRIILAYESVVSHMKSYSQITTKFLARQ